MATYIKEYLYLQEDEDGALCLVRHPSGDLEVIYTVDGSNPKTVLVGSADHVIRELMKIAGPFLIPDP